MDKAKASSPQTIQELHHYVGQILKDEPTVGRYDIDDIVAFSCNCLTSQLQSLAHQPVSQKTLHIAHRLAIRRLEGTPTPLLTGHTYFFCVPLAVKKGVLLPRPETEILVETVINWISTRYSNQKVTILELGVGSGAISLSLSKTLPQAQVVGWDISRRAFNLATTNLTTLNLNNCTFYHGDFFKLAPLWIKHHHKSQSPLIIVSNPPYIPSHILPTLDPSVQKNDPKRALDGGKSGLKFHQQLIRLASKLNAPLFLEIGYDQAQNIRNIAEESQMTHRIYLDYAQHPRVAEIIP